MVDFTKLPDWIKGNGDLGRFGVRKNGAHVEFWIKEGTTIVQYQCSLAALQRFINTPECEEIALAAIRK